MVQFFSKIDQVIQDLSQNEIFDLWFWPFTLGSRLQNIVFLFSFIWLLYGATFSKIGQTILDLSENEIFDFWFWPSGQGHKIVIFYYVFYGYYMEQLLAKLLKPFRVHCKMNYLTFDFNLWPWG